MRASPFWCLVLFALAACGPPTTDAASPLASSLQDAGPGDAGVSAECEAWARSLDERLASATQAVTQGGAGVGVWAPGCPRYHGHGGQHTNGDALDPQALFRIGSVTKTFVAAALLRAQEQGRLSLEDNIAQDAPQLPNAGTITLRQLLNHTSGVFNYTDDGTFQRAMRAQPYRVWQPLELVDYAAARQPYFSPGTGWHYSNTNYIIAALALQRVTGQPLAEYLRAQFLEPLHLQHTFLDGEETIPDTIMAGYDVQGRDVTYQMDPSWAWAAGAMVSNVDDLMTWAQALYNGNVLTPSSWTQLTQVVPTTAVGLSYGLGMFQLAPSIARTITLGHMGDLPGFHTQMFYAVAPGTTTVMFSNSDGFAINDVAAALLDTVVHAAPQP